MTKMTLNNLDQKGVENLAKRLADKVCSGDVLTLHGNLGAGKTTFARAFISSLLEEETEIPSPTFGLALTYESTKGPLWHYDLYRLKHPSELSELGLNEAFEGGITLIEWPEIANDLLPESQLAIAFTEHKDTSKRNVEMTCSEHWKDRLNDLS